MMLVTGIRDTRLKEKLSELEELTLPAFSILINAHLPTGSTALINKVYSPNNGNKKAQKGGKGQRQTGSMRVRVKRKEGQ